MPDEKLNNSEPEENSPPQNASENEQSSSPQDTGDISEPSMDDASSLSEEINSKESPDESGEKTGAVERTSSVDEDELSQEEIDKALEAANGSEGKASELQNDTPQTDFPDGEINVVKSKEFPELQKSEIQAAGQSIDMLLDVTLPISIELGRTSMPIEDILNLGPGSVVELNRLAGEPVDLLVNDKLIAKGEVVVVDENFGIRVTTMVSQEERLKSLL